MGSGEYIQCVLDKVECNRSVFTFAEIKRSHHLVHVVAALFPIENSVDNKWAKSVLKLRKVLFVCEDFTHLKLTVLFLELTFTSNDHLRTSSSFELMPLMLPLQKS